MDGVPGEFSGEGEAEGCHPGKDRGMKAGFCFIFTLMQSKVNFKDLDQFLFLISPDYFPSNHHFYKKPFLIISFHNSYHFGPILKEFQKWLKINRGGKKYLFSKVITLTGKTKHFLNFIQKYALKKYIDQYGLSKRIFNMVNIRNKLFEYKYL